MIYYLTVIQGDALDDEYTMWGLLKGRHVDYNKPALKNRGMDVYNIPR